MSGPRRFEILPEYPDAVLPRRATSAAAGYDLAAAADVLVAPGCVALIPSGVRAWMPEDEFLAIHIRSSVAIQRGLVLANGTGIIDADYAGSAGNGGHIVMAVRNLGSAPVQVRRGERIAQGLFLRYQTTGDDTPGPGRVGGLGSTRA